MALDSVRESVEELSDDLKAEYTKSEDGKYYLDINNVEALPALYGLKRKNGDLIGKNKEQKTKLDKYGEYGTIEQLEEARNAPTGDEKIDEIKATHLRDTNALKDNWAREKTVADAAVETERRAARTYFKKAAITTALGRSEPRGAYELVGHKLERDTKVVLSEGGDYELHIVDGDGTRRYKDSSGNFMSIDDLIVETAKNSTYAPAFAATGKGGSGANNDNGGGDGGGDNKVPTKIPNDPELIGKYAKEIREGTVQVEGFEG